MVHKFWNSQRYPSKDLVFIIIYLHFDIVHSKPGVNYNAYPIAKRRPNVETPNLMKLQLKNKGEYRELCSLKQMKNLESRLVFCKFPDDTK